MLDVAVAYNRYKFLGYEFLTWLWFMIENEQGQLKACDPEFRSLSMGNRIVLENSRNDTRETLTIKGDEAKLEEGVMALKKGAVVTELHLVCKAAELVCRFSIKGESMTLSGVKLPETGPVETGADLEGVLLEKTYLLERFGKMVERLYEQFLKQRLSNDWTRKTVPKIKRWIAA